MNRPVWVAAVGAAAIVGCEQAGEPSEDRGRVALQILAAPGGSVLDSGRVHVEGPTPRVVRATPGEQVTIEELQPGSYTVSLEGFVGLEVDRFGRVSNVQVVAGQTRSVTVQFDPFRPVLEPVTLNPDGQSFVVAFPPLAFADSYRVQVDASPDFPNPEEQTLTDTKTSFPTDGKEGTRFIRVQAFDPYEIPGVPTEPKEVAIRFLPSVPGLDGLATSTGVVNTIAGLTIVGDNGAGLFIRAFYSFDLSLLAPEDVVTGAVMRIFQSDLAGDPYKTLGTVTVDHLVYGGTLDAGDFGLAALTADIGTLSDNDVIEYKNLPVTEMVRADRAANRSLSQYRVRFTTDDNGDAVADVIALLAAETVDPPNPPQMVVVAE